MCDAPTAELVDSTGAGDIFAAAFLIHLRQTSDPLAAASFANQLAALSVSRQGLAGVPIKEDLYNIQTEVE